MRARDWRSQAKQRTPRSSSSTPDCELRAMIKREQEPKSPFVFTSVRGAPRWALREWWNASVRLRSRGPPINR